MKYLMVGLGNPGAEYEETRHNIGFKVVDSLAQRLSGSFETGRLGEVSTVRFKGRHIVLLKPSTFMNLSGKAVRYWMDAEKIPLERVVVITDDLNLPFGTLRLRAKGSDGGHNGLKDIQDEIRDDGSGCSHDASTVGESPLLLPHVTFRRMVFGGRPTWRPYPRRNESLPRSCTG